jgi:hypothetical protein
LHTDANDRVEYPVAQSLLDAIWLIETAKPWQRRRAIKEAVELADQIQDIIKGSDEEEDDEEEVMVEMETTKSGNPKATVTAQLVLDGDEVVVYIGDAPIAVPRKRMPKTFEKLVGFIEKGNR